MTTHKIQVGQVWKKVDSQETFLVTRLYTEAFTTIAVLRPAGNETAALLRVRIANGAEGQSLPGFSIAQGSDKF